MSFTLHGIPVSRGVAIGHSHRLNPAIADVPRYLIPEASISREVRRFRTAVAQVERELHQIKRDLPEKAPAELAAFLELHELILHDPLLADAPAALIRTHRYNAEWAITTQMVEVIGQFETIEDEYLRERGGDVRQVVERILHALIGSTAILPQYDATAAAEMILVAHDISPADMLRLRDTGFAGFITDLGGATSHTAIVARSLDIPAVVGLQNAHQLIAQGETIIIDGDVGVVVVDPPPLVLEEYRHRLSEIVLERKRLRRLRNMPAQTLDGASIEMLGNIELVDDVDDMVEEGGEGVGLFRTEYLFMNRATLPSEEEQFESYADVVKKLKGQPVTIRTLDIGADKTLGGSVDKDAVVATNPALGLRAIRFCISEPLIFMTQLRAILRASALGPVKLMIPMLAHAHEIEQSMQMIQHAKAQLDARGQAYDSTIQIGGMIEIPAAALSLGLFVKRLDFLSIGTNDLVQYTLAIDRANSSVAHLFDPLHPAVLYLMALTIQTGQKAGLPVSVCGEMAGEPKFTRLLLGMGLRQFSMHPTRLLPVKQEILRTDRHGIEAQVRKILRAQEPGKIRELLEELNRM
ncbi:MAG: phosphoenolpyruvate--protein phosphotransferase [Burkholderiaceae bacterium]|nr:MAG: phosphoenolpyruvate--protein phosphotransferase [Burkholderiaceae bacterium]